MTRIAHQYIHRSTGRVKTETLTADPVINTIYAGLRENAGRVFSLLVSGRMSALLGALSYDFPFQRPVRDPARFLARTGIDLTEVVGDPAGLTSLRDVFQRQIRYWDLRPMPDRSDIIVAPADARMLLGSFCDHHALCIKDKFFTFEELLGRDHWCRDFADGEFCVSRLTPEKYHYNHSPVAGTVKDIYEIDGIYHSCNPGAVVRVVTPYSKNRRVVTIIDTDVPGGTGVGLVAMVEVVAMMIGRIVQCYSERAYQDPKDVRPGLFLKKGAPKSLFMPGSSTTILIFQKGRIGFASDLSENLKRQDAQSRFSLGFGRPLVETEVAVRSPIAESAVAPPPGRRTPAGPQLNHEGDLL